MIHWKKHRWYKFLESRPTFWLVVPGLNVLRQTIITLLMERHEANPLPSRQKSRTLVWLRKWVRVLWFGGYVFESMNEYGCWVDVWIIAFMKFMNSWPHDAMRHEHAQLNESWALMHNTSERDFKVFLFCLIHLNNSKVNFWRKEFRRSGRGGDGSVFRMPSGHPPTLRTRGSE